MHSQTVTTEQINDSVPLEFTKALLTQARRYRCDVDALLQEARFPFDPLQQDLQSVFVSREQYSRLCVGLFRALGDESGGVMPSTPTPIGTTRLIGLSMINSATLAAAIRRGIEFNAACLVRDGEVVSSQLRGMAGGRQVSLEYHSSLVPPSAQHSSLCSLALWVRFYAWLIGQPIDIISAQCAGPEPEFVAAVRHFLPCPVDWGHSTNAVTFSARHLEAEIVRSEQELVDFLPLAPYALVIESTDGARSISHRIRDIIGSDFRNPLPSFEALTQRLNMSARTLRRRLEKEGTSYQRIKDNARRDLAISLLSREGMTVSDVAEQLGFSDPSAFHRSFKKWTGQSPGSYR